MKHSFKYPCKKSLSNQSFEAVKKGLAFMSHIRKKKRKYYVAIKMGYKTFLMVVGGLGLCNVWILNVKSCEPFIKRMRVLWNGVSRQLGCLEFSRSLMFEQMERILARRILGGVRNSDCNYVFYLHLSQKWRTFWVLVKIGV